MAVELSIRAMQRDELDVLVDWAAKEGWNPGLNDAEIFWNTDPEGFIAAELEGELVGGGSIVSYGGRFGFMGFFIMRPDFRGRGLGRELWNFRKQRLVARLEPPAVIGMDGVFDMQAFYARGGFELCNRDLRFEGEGMAADTPDGILALSEVPFEQVLAYDTAHFPAERRIFLEAWISQPGARALGAVSEDRLMGYGVVRPCRTGYKIGPLFAADPGVAERLFTGLSDHACGEPLYLDVPEINTDALALARRHGMREVFGCARMYFGPAPKLPGAEIFGVTTFELG